jgi:hypothetical protein
VCKYSLNRNVISRLGCLINGTQIVPLYTDANKISLRVIIGISEEEIVCYTNINISPKHNPQCVTK